MPTLMPSHMPAHMPMQNVSPQRQQSAVLHEGWRVDVHTHARMHRKKHASTRARMLARSLTDLEEPGLAYLRLDQCGLS